MLDKGMKSNLKFGHLDTNYHVMSKYHHAPKQV